MRTDSVLLRVGSHVVIRPEGIEALGGTVRWIAGDCAGVEFDRAIYDPIIDHLVALHHSHTKVALSRD